MTRAALIAFLTLRWSAWPTWAHPILIGSQIVMRDADSVSLWSL